MSELLVIGSVALDTIRTKEAVKKEILGGSATFFSISASFFTKVNLVATVGKDFPKKNIDLIISFKVDTKGLDIKEGKTFRWEGSYAEDINCARTINTQLNVFQDFMPELPGQYTKNRFIFLANIDPDLQLHLIKNSKDKKIIGCDSMNYWIQNKCSSLKKLMKHVDVMFLNDLEAKEFSGESNILKAGRYILSLGPKFAIIKRGEYGAILFSKDSSVLAIPALLLEKVIDPTGAGDSFAGGFMGYLANKNKFTVDIAKKALLYGTVMASYAVEDFSVDRFLKLKKRDIEKRLGEFKGLINV
ncbi:MAG: PfkB family carbohydrate kinase [Candidatus Omnitrophota bacterium]